jgi:uncharacterized repeat protein (TIGR01451 family)
MNSFNKKLILAILFCFLIGFFKVPISLGATATFYGEIPDDGGDPNLVVWFEYGKTTSYGRETPHQTKYGKGEFTATVSDLENCTTYHYRAVAKHQNYDDIRYGEDKIFTTPCATVTYPAPTVDIKANGFDGSITIPYNSSAILSWTSSNTTSCVASGAWSGAKPTAGLESTGNLTSGPKTYTITCYGPGGLASDSVTISLSQVLGAVSPTIQKKVRNLSDGQVAFSESILANPNEVLEFQIQINAGSGIQNATLKDILPERIIFRKNSLKVNGVSVEGDITSGISLGNLDQNQTKTITFLADVAGADKFSFGDTTLTNTATLSWNGNSLSDSANVVVKKGAVAGAATEAPTGLIGDIFFDYLFFPLVLIFGLICLFKSHILKWEEWLDERKKEYQKFRAEKLLELKTTKIKMEKFLGKKLP